MTLDGSNELFPDTATFSVVELCEAVSITMRNVFRDSFWVKGEIRSLRRANSGHVYFQLIEPAGLGAASKAALNVSLFRSQKADVNASLRRLPRPIRMSDGVEIRLRARLEFHAQRGQLGLVMLDIDPTYTLGRLVEDKDRLLESLASEGLLDQNRSRPLAESPLHVALVTSVDSAADHDVRDELVRSGLGWQIMIVPTAVQGRDAPQRIADAIRRAARSPVDVIAVVRGGGSRTDLAAFDHELVARAIGSSSVPVWTGIGHEIDESVADRVAHRSFKTPTACAAALVERVNDHHDRCEESFARIVDRVLDELDDSDQRTAQIGQAIAAASASTLRLAHAQIAHLVGRLERAATTGLRAASSAVELAATRTDTLDPARTLARGWSIVRASDGSVVRSVDQLSPGSTLLTTLADGVVVSTAKSVDRSGPEQ